VEGLAGVEGGGGVVEAVGAKDLAADAERILVVSEGLVELVELDVDTSDVVEGRGDVDVVVAEGLDADGEGLLEQVHSLVGRRVLLLLLLIFIIITAAAAAAATATVFDYASGGGHYLRCLHLLRLV